jgi:hypothetical protein
MLTAPLQWARFDKLRLPAFANDNDRHTGHSLKPLQRHVQKARQFIERSARFIKA